MRKLLPFIVVAAFVACTTIDCPVQNTVSTLYHVYNADGTDLTLKDTLTVTTRRSNGTDSIILNQLSGSNSFSLPISYSHPEDVLVFSFTIVKTDTTLRVQDTLWVKKEDIPHFESVDCNASFFHTLTDVRCTHNHIDSIVINNPSVTYDQTTIHFRLYPKSSN